jgi:MoxR-like ATPase
MAVATNKHAVISKVAHGWNEIEPAIVAFVAAELPFLMQGMHGNAKTTVGKLIGLVFGDDTFRYVDCAKANLISMCGFPDMDKMKQGEQAFVPNNRSLIGSDKFKVRVALLDEITRASKETGNQLLEFIENRTIYGIKTGVQVVMATANPDSYKGATKMDAALLDRFVACLPINDFKEVTADDVEAMIRINIDQELDPKYVEKVGKELKDMVARVQKKYKELVSDTDVQDRIGAYAANMVSMCKAKWGGSDDAPYLSGREAASQFWRAIIALAAYYIEVYKQDPAVAFVSGARDAIKYCWITKHGMEETFSRTVETVHKDMIFLLRATAKGPAGKVGIAYAKAMSPQAKLNFWEQHLDAVTTITLPPQRLRSRSVTRTC